MAKKSFLISICLVVLGFVLGFLLANVFNRGELEMLRTENERLKLAEPAEQEKSGQSLTATEIDQRLAASEKNPTDFQFQKNLGLALYRYGAVKQDSEIIEKVLPVLGRAHSLNRDDRDVVIGLGNAHFDIGYFRKSNERLARAREYYRLALAQKPGDADVLSDLGLTYFLQEPPDLAAAVEEFRMALEAEPNHEKTLQFLVQALAKQERSKEAAEYLERLKKAHPSSPSINELANILAKGSRPTER